MNFRLNGQSVSQTFGSRADLVSWLRTNLASANGGTGTIPDPADIEAVYDHDSPGPDGWGPTYEVTLEGYGLVGWSDDPLLA